MHGDRAAWFTSCKGLGTQHSTTETHKANSLKGQTPILTSHVGRRPAKKHELKRRGAKSSHPTTERTFSKVDHALGPKSNLSIFNNYNLTVYP